MSNDMRENFVKWIEGQQTLTDVLKREIIARFREEIERAADEGGRYVDEYFPDENYTYTKGEQYYENRFFK
jgi:hypothetical protein